MTSQSSVSQAVNALENEDEVIQPSIEEDTPKGFDVSKYTISNALETQTLYIDDTSFDVKIKHLSWSTRNKILSQSLILDAKGNTSFDGDTYIRNCLKEMLVEAPWGRTTEAFLLTIDYRLGAVLEELVPKAFGDDEGGTPDTETLKEDT